MSQLDEQDIRLGSFAASDLSVEELLAGGGDVDLLADAGVLAEEDYFTQEEEVSEKEKKVRSQKEKEFEERFQQKVASMTPEDIRQNLAVALESTKHIRLPNPNRELSPFVKKLIAERRARNSAV